MSTPSSSPNYSTDDSVHVFPAMTSPPPAARIGPFSPGGFTVSTVLSKPWEYGVMSPVAIPRSLPDLEELQTEVSMGATSSPQLKSLEKSVIRTKVEELEDAFSVLQTCATTATALQEADKTHSENYYENQNAVVEQYWRQEVDALIKKHKLELEAKDSENKARINAEQLLLKQKYSDKLESFKKKVQAAENSYRDKHIQILGALDESRRELLASKKAASIREENLRNEIVLLNSHLSKEMNKSKNFEYEQTQKAKWQSVAVELASNIIELSTDATFIEMPEEKFARLNSYHETNNNNLIEDRAIVSKSFLGDLALNSKVVHTFDN